MKIGIDIGGSHIGIGVIENKTIIAKQEIEIIENMKKKSAIETYLIENSQKFIEKYDIEQIGIAVPGMVKEGVITSLVNLKIQNWHLQEIMYNHFHIPVNMKNDAKCAAMAEKTYGALKNDEDCVFLCLGTGVGASVFLQGKPLIPKRNTGFEIGHMIIQKDGIPCNCGKRGCFETYCSIKRLKENLITILDLEQTTDAKQLLAILKEQRENPKAQAIIQEYLENLLVGISNIIDIFEPQVICLGGSFVYFKEILYIPFLKLYEERKYTYNKQDLPRIVLGSFQNDAGMIGATI